MGGWWGESECETKATETERWNEHETSGGRGDRREIKKEWQRGMEAEEEGRREGRIETASQQQAGEP